MIEIGRKLLILTGIIVSGCATREPLATFYTLDPGGDIHSATKQSNGRSVRVYVNRVVLPAYLNRTNLASFRNNQIEYSTWAFWAIPLDQAIAQAVARDLSAAGVSAFGFEPMASPPPHSYEVTVRITRCEGYDSGDVVLSGVWELRSAGDGRIIASKAFAIHRSGWQSGHYPSLASLLTDEVRELSTQIASQLR